MGAGVGEVSTSGERPQVWERSRALARRARFVACVDLTWGTVRWIVVSTRGDHTMGKRPAVSTKSPSVAPSQVLPCFNLQVGVREASRWLDNGVREY